MKKAFIFVGLITLVLAACQQDKTGSNEQQQNATQFASANLLAGHWFALDFCSRAAQYGSVLGAMNNAHKPYAYSISFNPTIPDSVFCSNGFEDWTLAVEYRKDTLELKNARPGKSIFLVYNSQTDKNMTMFDVTTGQAHTDIFMKSRAGAKSGHLAFLTALNHNLFSGTFSSVGKGSAGGNIQFTPGGFIMNFKPFDRYEVCTAGDCFIAGNDIDVITLSNSKQEGSARMYGYKYNGGNDTLTMYNLATQKPDEKGSYKVGAPVYTFVRKQAE